MLAYQWVRSRRHFNIGRLSKSLNSLQEQHVIHHSSNVSSLLTRYRFKLVKQHESELRAADEPRTKNQSNSIKNQDFAHCFHALSWY